MHVHFLDFDEHVHSEDSMPRGAHIHFQRRTFCFQKKIHRKEMTKTRSNEDVFEILTAENVVEDVTTLTKPVYGFQYF